MRTEWRPHDRLFLHSHRHDRKPNGNRPAMDRPRIGRDPISLASLQRNEGTVAIGLGADIAWVSALDRSVANNPGTDIDAVCLDVVLETLFGPDQYQRARRRAISARRVRTKAWKRSADGVNLASRTRSTETTLRTFHPRTRMGANDPVRNSAATR